MRPQGRVPAADWLARYDVGSAKPALLPTARDAARGRLLTLLAGLFAAGALIFTALNFNLSRRTFELAARDVDAARAELARARQEPKPAQTLAAGRRRRGGLQADAEGDTLERSQETGPVAFWRSNATALGVAAAALGGVLYVLLTWVTSWVYQPAGVRPSDVGLGYVPLLAGTAVTLVGALAVVLAAVAVALGTAWLRTKRAWVRLGLAIIALGALVYVSVDINDVAAFFLIPLPSAAFVAILWPKHAYKMIAIFATIIVLAVAGVTVWNSASQARRDIQDVASSAPIGLNNPWEGEIANVQRIGSTSKTVTCGLYLGESNGTGVFVVNEGTEQVKQLRTVRLPLSSVLIEILPDHVLC